MKTVLYLRKKYFNINYPKIYNTHIYVPKLLRENVHSPYLSLKIVNLIMSLKCKGISWNQKKKKKKEEEERER